MSRRKRAVINKISFKSEFHAEIAGRKSDFYVLENLSSKMADKGDDILFYRLRFTDKGGFPHGNHPFDVTITRINNRRKKKKHADSLVEEESMELDERIYFQVKFPTILDQKVKRSKIKGINNSIDTFLILPNFQVHMNGDSKVKAIYFILEDNQMDESKQDVPKWSLDINKDYCFERMFGSRYIPLDHVHPDPLVDVSHIPSHKQPQRGVKWFENRLIVKDPKVSKVIKGKIGGSKVVKMTGFYKSDGFNRVNPSRILKLGRIEEDSVLVSYLDHYKNRKVSEIGWCTHPKDPLQGSSPDWLTHDSEMSMSTLPDWLTLIYKKHGIYEKVKKRIKYGVGEAKVSERDSDFKASYIPQLYQEMICSDTYWSDLVKYCPTTGEIKCYRVYRQPGYEEDHVRVIQETKKALVSGIPHYNAVDTPFNKSVRSKCIKMAVFYNGNNYEPESIPISPLIGSLKNYKRKMNSQPKVKIEKIPLAQKRKRETKKPVQDSYMQSDLWRIIKSRTISINDLLKSGDKESIISDNMIDDQISDYNELAKRLRFEDE